MSDDLTIIANYIARCRSFGLGHRYGGLQWMYEDGREALEALKRLQQPSFWSQFPRDEDELSRDVAIKADSTGTTA